MFSCFFGVLIVLNYVFCFVCFQSFVHVSVIGCPVLTVFGEPFDGVSLHFYAGQFVGHLFNQQPPKESKTNISRGLSWRSF